MTRSMQLRIRCKLSIFHICQADFFYGCHILHQTGEHHYCQLKTRPDGMYMYTHTSSHKKWSNGAVWMGIEANN